jgi:tetratricopeptide (TPR) repeat protein/TolB-like protein
MLYNDIAGPMVAADDTISNRFPAAEVRSALDRILASRAFIHSHRIRTFLKFVVEECLTGQHHRLKEYLIGMEVFNRTDIFDPRVDSIVRVEARRLRAKLEEYYSAEGREEELRIVLRKGSYVPVFEYRRNNPQGFSYGSLHSQRRSLALTPFTIRDNGQEHAGLIDEITRRLTHILIKEGYFQVLQTLAPEGTFPKLDYIVEGNVELRGEQIRILLQLLNVKDTSHVWSETVDCTTQDLSPVEALARALNRELLMPSGEGARAKLRPENRTAYDCYLQGRFEWKRGVPDGIRASVSLFQKAVEADPSYGAAWAALAEASLVSYVLGFKDPANGVDVTSAARGACELNPDLPEAHIALGAALSMLDSDWAGGEQELQRAIQLGPTDPTALVAYGVYLGCRGSHDAAIVEVERALEMDPAGLLPNFVLGWLYGVAGRLDDAIAQHRQVAKMAPEFALSHAGLGWVFAAKNLFEEAISHLRKSGPILQGLLGYCLARAGHIEEAQRELSQLNGHCPVTSASIHAGLGDRDRAVACLEEAMKAHDPTLPVHWWDPQFAALREDPRLRALLPQL